MKTPTTKTLTLTLTAAIALAATLLAAQSGLAQNAGGRPNRNHPADANGAAATDTDSTARPRRPLPPLVAALDANQDGTIDATEIANAVAALKKLDSNGDGTLTADELHPGRPDGNRGGGRQGRGPRGPRPGTEPAPAE